MTVRIALIAALAALLPLSAMGEEGASKGDGVPDPSIATSLPPRLADPGGHRAALAKRGVTYGLNYIGEVIGVPSGGVKRGSQYDGRLEAYTDVDLEKLVGLRGLTFHASAFQIHGTSVTARNVGSIAPVSFIEATPATRLFEVWLEQSLFDGKVSVRAGQLAADSEFLTSEGGGAFINGTFGWPTIAASSLPDGGPAYPLAAPGVRVKVKPTDRLTLMAAVFNGQVARPSGCDDPQRCNRHGTDFPLGDPVLLMVEGTYKFNISLPGTVKLGGWHHDGNFDHVRTDDTGMALASGGSSGVARVLSGNHGLYGVVDQLLYRAPGTEDKGTGLFARVVGTPDDRNLIDLYLEGGLTFSGLIRGRPDDVFGIGVAYSRISSGTRGFDKDRNADAGIGAATRDYEALLEISYTAQIVPGWTLQPDFQYFWHPGGGGVDPDDDATAPARARDVAVLGLRTTIKY